MLLLADAVRVPLVESGRGHVLLADLVVFEAAPVGLVELLLLLLFERFLWLLLLLLLLVDHADVHGSRGSFKAVLHG